MSELTEIREALAAKLDAALPGFQVSAYILADPQAPSVYVFPAGVEFHRASGDGLAFWTFTVRALVGLASDIGGQQTLDSLMGENSGGVKATLEADPTLGGVCDDVTVVSVSNYQTYAKDSALLLGGDWTVQVYR